MTSLSRICPTGDDYLPSQVPHVPSNKAVDEDEAGICPHPCAFLETRKLANCHLASVHPLRVCPAYLLHDLPRKVVWHVSSCLFSFLLHLGPVSREPVSHSKWQVHSLPD